MSLCWREDSLAAVVSGASFRGATAERGGVFSWAETRVVVKRCGRLPAVAVSERERHTNQTNSSLREIATRVFDPETASSSRRIVITTG